MYSLYTLSFIFSASTIIIITIILFSIKPTAKLYSKSFQTIKYYALADAILELINQSIVISYNEKIEAYLLYDYLLTPLIYSIQLYIINKLFMTLFHTKIEITNKIFYGCMISLFSMLILYYWGVDMKILSPIAYIIMTAWVIFNLIIIQKGKNNYFLLLENIHSGDKLEIGKHIASIMHLVYFYFFLVVIDFLIYPSSYTPFMIVYSLIFTAFTIKLINAQNFYTSFETLYHTNAAKEIVPSIEKSINEDHSNEMNEALKVRIANWEMSHHKPYLKEGITLISVAEEIKIPPAKLSFYLNNFLDINFNIWINNLRILEAKSIIKDNKNITLLEISSSVGFREPATFSKTFKKIVGMTPSEYRKLQYT